MNLNRGIEATTRCSNAFFGSLALVQIVSLSTTDSLLSE